MWIMPGMPQTHIPGFPNALTKALSDQFTYMLMLKNGAMIEFESAELQGDYPPVSADHWVRLHGVKMIQPAIKGEDPINFERGLDVRVSEIVWVVDAPYGS